LKNKISLGEKWSEKFKNVVLAPHFELPIGVVVG
jgi:hypothetical protein